MSGADGGAGSGREGIREASSDGVPQSFDGAAHGTEDGPALVLIVEDEEPIAEALAFIVEEAGYEPLKAKHGRQALELARARHPDLIFTDLMMPVMDGAELIARLRAEGMDGAGRVPPIVLMTAGGLRRAETVGADEVLAKPFDVESIEALLRKYISKR